jgi:regulator of Ty1 transposition protein 103
MYHTTSLIIILDLDKSRSSTRKPLFGSSLLGSSSIPTDIQPLIPLQAAVSKLPSSTKIAFDNGKQEYMKIADPSTPLPTPPVYAARLSGLLKTLANAEGAVAEGIKARRALVEALEKLLDTNRNALNEGEVQHLELANWKAEIDQKKRDVEDSIMRGLAEEASPASHANGSPGSEGAGNRVARESISSEPERAPSVEALTPTGSPPPQTNFAPRATASDFFEDKPNTSAVTQQQFVPAAGSDLLSSLAMPYGRPAVGSQANGSSAKKRKLNDAEDFAGLGGDDALAGLDDDVAEILRRDSGGF